jgi:hypothetical protein
MHRLTWLGAVVLLLSPPTAWSHEPPAIARGSRIRITELGGVPRAGTVVAIGADTVVLKLDSNGDTVTFSLAKLSRLEVSRGRKGHAAAGAGLGFLIGAGTGAMLGLNCENDGCLSGSDEPVAAAAGIGGIVAGVVGGVVGASQKTEKWEEVPLDASTSASRPQ